MQCKFIRIKCYRRECGESFLKEDVHNHNEVCLYNTYCCQYCQNYRILRMNQADHEKLCKMEQVRCVYDMVGCLGNLCRGEVEQHEQESLSKHLKLTFEKMIKNEKLLEESTKKNNHLNYENDKLKEEVSKLNNEVKQISTQVLFLMEKIKCLTTKNYKSTNRTNANEIEKLKKLIKEKTSFLKTENDTIIIDSSVVKSWSYRIRSSAELHELIMSSKYEENCNTIITSYYRSSDADVSVLELFKLLPYHWYDFTCNALVNEDMEIQHLIKFPIHDNEIEDFCCQYKEITVQCINGTIQVLYYQELQKDYKIQVSIGGANREVAVGVECDVVDLFMISLPTCSKGSIIIYNS